MEVDGVHFDRDLNAALPTKIQHATEFVIAQDGTSVKTLLTKNKYFRPFCLFLPVDITTSRSNLPDFCLDHSRVSFIHSFSFFYLFLVFGFLFFVPEFAVQTHTVK